MPEVILLVPVQLSDVVQRHVIQGAHIITHFRISTNMSEFQWWEQPQTLLSTTETQTYLTNTLWR